MKPAIRVENLSKQYQLGQFHGAGYRTLREEIVRVSNGIWNRLTRAGQDANGQNPPHDARNSLWALRDVSFEVQPGEVVGVVGRNGAGKSTLLKVLSRIVEPTRGRAVLRGRLGSLLEVGTGFHPELTGRENVYLNGSILGLTRNEIERKFDEIVAFSGIEQFLDTPVKRYSSGMYVRLAFAVAAHLEPEILIVDEVLAVGDTAFQKKCLNKMNDVAASGRTVLFVSHNLAAVKGLCQRGILMEHGKVVLDDTVDAVVSRYLRGLEESVAIDLRNRTDRKGAGLTRLVDFQVVSDETGQGLLMLGASAQFVFRVSEVLPSTVVSFTIHDQFGQAVAHFNSKEDITPEQNHAENPIVCDIEELLLVPGRYTVSTTVLSNRECQDQITNVAAFTITEGNVRGRIVSHCPFAQIYLPHRWSMVPAEATAG